MPNRCNLACAGLILALAPALAAGGTVALENPAKGEWTARLVPLVQFFRTHPFPEGGLRVQPKTGEAFDLIPGHRTHFPIKAGDSFALGMNGPILHRHGLICCLELEDSAGKTLLVGIHAWNAPRTPKPGAGFKAAPTIAIYPATLPGQGPKPYRTDPGEQVFSIVVDHLGAPGGTVETKGATPLASVTPGQWVGDGCPAQFMVT